MNKINYPEPVASLEPVASFEAVDSTDSINAPSAFNSRRRFLKSVLSSSVVCSVMMTNISMGQVSDSNSQYLKHHVLNLNKDIVRIEKTIFTHSQHLDLQSVYLCLFPDDGDGPSANDLNVVTYLEWAMGDKDNIADGDSIVIVTGLNKLNKLSTKVFKLKFIELSIANQMKLLKQMQQTQLGENWLSILSYYLIEALTLDPFYGGNTNQVGWHWLKHQGGYPHPVMGKTYRDFQ